MPTTEARQDARAGAAVRRSPGNARGTSIRLLDGLERLGLPIVFALMVLFFATGSEGDAFMSKANLENILGGQAVVGVVALAMIPPLVAGYFDLSVAAIAGISNVAIAAAIGRHGVSVEIAILIGIALGATIGFLNGFAVAKLRLNAFIVTFGSYVLLTGVLTWYTKGNQIIENIPPSIGAWGGEHWLGLPRPFVALVAIAGFVWFLLSNVPWGRYLESIGSNESAARLVGINVDRALLLTFILSGGLAGVAGALLTSTLGGADAGAGPSFLFPAFAAVFLGATTIRPGRYNVWGTVIGVMFVGTAVSGLSILGADSWIQPVFNGGSLIIAVALSTFSGRARARREAGAAGESVQHESTPTGGRGST
jgi:ribose transport system permease protein